MEPADSLPCSQGLLLLRIIIVVAMIIIIFGLRSVKFGRTFFFCNLHKVFSLSRARVCMYMCMCVCVYVCVCICIHARPIQLPSPANVHALRENCFAVN